MDAPASWRGVTGSGHAREHSGSAFGLRHTGHVDLAPTDTNLADSWAWLAGRLAMVGIGLAVLFLVGSAVRSAAYGLRHPHPVVEAQR